jgi:hypothetical protein
MMFCECKPYKKRSSHIGLRLCICLSASKPDRLALSRVNTCKLTIALHHSSSSLPVSPTEGFGHCFVNARRLRQPLHPSRLFGVLEFTPSSLSPLPPCCSHSSRASLCVSAVTGFGFDSLAKPRARSSLASNRSIQCSPPCAPSVRPAKEAAIAVFRHCGRAAERRYGYAVIAIALDRDVLILAL